MKFAFGILSLLLAAPVQAGKGKGKKSMEMKATMVTNGMDMGEGSLRAALDSGASKIEIADDVDMINIDSTLVYMGTKKLSIEGSGQPIMASGDFNMLNVMMGADLKLEGLTFQGPGGFSREGTRGDGKGIFLFVPRDTTGKVKVDFEDVTVMDVAYHGVHISDCDNDEVAIDLCGNGNSGGGEGSPATLEIKLEGVSIKNVGQGYVMKLPGVSISNVDDLTVNYYYALTVALMVTASVSMSAVKGVLNFMRKMDTLWAQGPMEWNLMKLAQVTTTHISMTASSSRMVIGAWALILRLKLLATMRGIVCYEMKRECGGSVLSSFLMVYYFIFLTADVDDGLDMDEDGDGSLYLYAKNVIMDSNFDEGFDIDEAGDGDLKAHFEEIYVSSLFRSIIAVNLCSNHLFLGRQQQRRGYQVLRRR